VSDLLLASGWSGGIYHLPNEGDHSLFEVAKLIKSELGLDTQIEPVGQEHFPSNIKRPKNALLVNSKLPKLRPFKAALADFLGQS
jgi:dTDP-4-dehydrorhamnose reductase